MHLSVALSTLAFAMANANSILYMGSTQSASFDTAQSRCASFGGQLATFGSVGEFEALLNVRNGLGGVDAWIGLDDRGTEGHYGFIDGDTSFCQGTGNGLDCDDIPQWSPNEPSGGGDCGYLWGRYDGLLDDTSCSKSLPFVCEFNGDNYAAIEEGGAIYVARGDDSVDYATAKTRCAGFGGQLATYSNEAQFEAMRSVRRVIGGSPWMGFDDINIDHHWQFVDGDLSFCQPQGAGTDCDDLPQWAPGEPSGGGDCGYLWSNYDGLLDDTSCSKSKPYVCEFEADSFAFTTEIPVIDDDVCALCDCDGQASYFVFEVTGLEGSGTLMLFSAMMLCIVCLSCLLCKSYQSAHAKGKGYGKVVMDTDSEL